MPIIVPYIPKTITVHMGPPNQWAENVTVSFPDYVKNVASSEIYPTWEPAAIRANVLAIISFALNRVYTEFYPSRGYDFQITATTAYDQKFIRGRDIFQNISQVVDEIFNDYIRRVGFIEPLSAKFCNGTTSTCDGLSQWGSQHMAQEGADSMEILTHYYGSNIELVLDAPIRDLTLSYPGAPLRRGSVGEDVLIVQAMLNRIGRNYPAIPKISPASGVFDEATERSVKVFQRTFNLTPDGIVGKATWYKMVYLYVGVLQLAELVSEGQTIDRVDFQYSGILREGDRGEHVEALQYMLALLAEFDNALLPIQVDSIFGPRTTQAVLQYQTLVGLTPDGIVGKDTWRSLLNHFSLASGAPGRESVRASKSGLAALQKLGNYQGTPLQTGQSDQKEGE